MPQAQATQTAQATANARAQATRRWPAEATAEAGPELRRSRWLLRCTPTALGHCTLWSSTAGQAPTAQRGRLARNGPTQAATAWRELHRAQVIQ